MRVVSNSTGIRESQPKFTGRYSLEAGFGPYTNECDRDGRPFNIDRAPGYKPYAQRLNRITKEIKQKAQEQNLPIVTVDVENQTRRIFLTGEDAIARQAELDKVKKLSLLLESALDALNTAVDKVFRAGNLDLGSLFKDSPGKKAYAQVLNTALREGRVSQEELDYLEQHKVTNFWSGKTEIKPPFPSVQNKQVLYRSHPQRTNTVTAIREGKFDVETGDLSPDVQSALF